LRELDRYILWKGICRPEQIDEAFAAHWMFCVPGHAAGTKNMRLQLLRGFCRYLLRLDLLKENPAQKVPYLRVRPYKPYIFTLKELACLLEEAGSWKNRKRHSFLGWTMETLIHLIYACGLRQGEALRLKIKDIDFDENTLSLWKTKFHKERLVPFGARIRQRLIDYLAARAGQYPELVSPEDYVFCHSRGCYKGKGWIDAKFRRILVACGLAKPKGRGYPRLHDLRHSMATHRLYKWYQEGHNILNKLPLLSTYLGHVSIENTQVYISVTQALLREGNRRFKEQAETVPQKFLEAALKKKHANR
jgi:site-specific recombinase XerD